MIRKATLPDYQKIIQLCSANKITVPFVKLENTNQIFVFEDKRQIKGVIGLEAPHIVSFLVVDSNFKRKKIATKLLRYVRRNRAHLMIHILIKNIAALRFFQNLGFKAVAETNSPAAEETKVLMAWAQGCFSGFKKFNKEDS